MDFKKIVGSLIFIIGAFAFIGSISNNNLNFALIYLTAALILWVLYSLIVDAFDVQIFAWIISASGLLVAISIFFMFGIEEVPYPVGAIVFHSGGLAGALCIGFFAIFPILILHQTGAKKLPQITRTEPVMSKVDMEPEIENNEWEIASDDDLQSGEFEVG